VVWILKELTKIEIATFLMYLLLYLLFITIAYIYICMINLIAMLMILAVFSIFFGFITKDMFIGLGSGFFSDNALFIHPSHEIMLDTEFGVPTLFKLLPLVFTISLSVIAIVLSEYLSTILIYFKLSRVGYNIFSFFNQRFLIELFYNRFITGIILKLGGQTTKVLDKGSVEYIGPYGLEKGLLNISNNIAKLSTGVITSYALYILIGLILYLLFYSYINNSIIILSLVISLSLVSFESSVGIGTVYRSASVVESFYDNIKKQPWTHFDEPLVYLEFHKLQDGSGNIFVKHNPMNKNPLDNLGVEDSFHDYYIHKDNMHFPAPNDKIYFSVRLQKWVHLGE